MKRINWQRLATIGLCSSLVINAFSGVTAIAETVTSESSPTVANSIKEATPASSARQESTESSQKTTETSQEEVTQETAKQAETKAPLETPEIKTNTTEQPAENSSENDRQKSISPRWVPNNQVIYPRITLAFTNEFISESQGYSRINHLIIRHPTWRNTLLSVIFTTIFCRLFCCVCFYLWCFQWRFCLCLFRCFLCYFFLTRFSRFLTAFRTFLPCATCWCCFLNTICHCRATFTRDCFRNGCYARKGVNH